MWKIIVSIVSGGISGWLSGKIMNSRFTLPGNVGIGIVGGLVGSFILKLIGISGSGFFGNIIVSVIGACILIAVSRAIKKR